MMDITVGLPEHVHPLAVLGGDHARWAMARVDLVAAALGVVAACFGFRTRQTRALGAVVMAGLWFVSREGYVLAGGGLFVVGAIFLASRFVRATKLFVASGAILVGALFGGRFALAEGTAEPTREMLVDHPTVPAPEATHATTNSDGSLDTKAGITPVSLSLPTSERYVQSSRQLVTKERPSAMRIVYVTSASLVALQLGWLVLVGLLAGLHRDRLVWAWGRARERLRSAPPPVEQPFP